MDVLYHLTTEKGLQGILKDNKIKACYPYNRIVNRENQILGENGVYFASCPEDCLLLAPDCCGDRTMKWYYDRFYKQAQKFSGSYKKVIDKYYKWVCIENRYPVLEIPVAWIGETHKQKCLGRYEYVCYHDVLLKDVPKIIYVSTPSYYRLIHK